MQHSYDLPDIDIVIATSTTISTELAARSFYELAEQLHFLGPAALTGTVGLEAWDGASWLPVEEGGSAVTITAAVWNTVIYRGWEKMRLVSGTPEVANRTFKMRATERLR